MQPKCWTEVETIKFSPALKITNLDQLPKGTGAKYLMALRGGDGYIASHWKRTMPKRLGWGWVVIVFAPARGANGGTGNPGNGG